ASTQRSTTWEPMNPAPPVTRIFTARIMRACLPAAKRLVEPALGPSRVRAKVGAMTAPGGTAAGREPAGLGRLFAPRAIALIGVPGDLSRPGARPLHFLQRHGYTGRLYPLNPGHRTIRDPPPHPSRHPRAGAPRRGLDRPARGPRRRRSRRVRPRPRALRRGPGRGLRRAG